MDLNKKVKVAAEKKAAPVNDKELQCAFGKENYRLM